MYKRDYTIIISADVNDEVYWQMLRKGEPAACNEEEEKLVEEMFGEVFHKLEVNAFWRQSKREEFDEDKFCRDNCKGYQQIGRCLADGRCKAYIENEKNKH